MSTELEKKPRDAVERMKGTEALRDIKRRDLLDWFRAMAVFAGGVSFVTVLLMVLFLRMAPVMALKNGLLFTLVLSVFWGGFSLMVGGREIVAAELDARESREEVKRLVEDMDLSGALDVAQVEDKGGALEVVEPGALGGSLSMREGDEG